MSAFTQYFLNPAFVVPGAALCLLPIVIHLLSRLRYKKVRFAAMEFLLQSDELNRRRLIIEQLLLLLLRVLAVFLIMLLLARLLLDPSALMLLRGATTHHVIILDDSLSMRHRDGTETLFDRAVGTVESMLSPNEGRSGDLRVSLLLMSQPERPVLTDRVLDGALVQDLIPRLRNVECSHDAATPTAALEIANSMLSGDGGVAPQVHVITDLRRSDWTASPDVQQSLAKLEEIDAQVSVVQLSADVTDNVLVADLSADTLAVATGVPWRMQLTLTNHSDIKRSGLRATVLVDGETLPVKVLIPDIEPRDSVALDHDITFDASGLHEVEIRLDDDVLREDNSRFLVVDVTQTRSVLIVDDEAGQSDAGFVADALSPDPRLSGVTASIRGSDVLTTVDLTDFDCVYLLNIRELPADATQRLADYVRSGGGIAWFPDNQANITWYNTTLRSGDEPLFPVPIGTVTEVAARPDENTDAFLSPVFAEHPVFEFYNDPEIPLADTIRVAKWYSVSEKWQADENLEGNVRVLARLKNGAPVIFEHSLGQGRVMTFLTTAGRRWTNWPVMPAGPGYVVMNILMHRYLQRPSDAVELREVGEALKFRWPVDEFRENIQITLPADPNAADDRDTTADDNFLRLKASPENVAHSDDETNSDGKTAPNAAADGVYLTVSVPQATRPGVYRLTRFPAAGDAVQTWIGMNVATTESDLTPADAASVEALSESGNIRVISGDSTGGLSGSDAGRELRWVLLGLLVFVLLAEQLLSLRLSFHPEVKA